MIIVKKNFKQGSARLKISLLDDLWYLSHIIAPGDLVTSKTERKLKLGGDDERSSTVRKTLTLTLTVDDVALEDGGVLRVKGTVAQGTDDVAAGAHHSFGLSLHDEFTLRKSSWPRYLQEKLDEAANNSAQDLLIVVFDREEALLARVSQQGITQVGQLKGEVQNKQYSTTAANTIIDELLSQVDQLCSQREYHGIVFAAPNFWHAPLQKKFSDKLKKKAVVIAAHGVAMGTVAKLLARPELQQVLQSQRMRKEQLVVDEALASLSQEQLAYGWKDVFAAAQAGAVSSLAVTDTFLQRRREEDSYDQLDELMRSIDSAQGTIHLLYDDATMKVIDGLGGIVGTLRWKIS